MEVAKVSVLQHETGPWVEVIFRHINSNYCFMQKGPEARPTYISGWKPGSEGRSPAPRLSRRFKAKMLEVTAAVAKGRYLKLGLVPDSPKPAGPEPKTAPLFPGENIPERKREPRKPPFRRQVLRYPSLRQPLLA